ncbi:MAG: MBL fold metallo-hydrolase [Gemmatimonadetes bacterium]|nr:MBL fold metallo-hydrolase [Gemmatimonadota bacterium]MCC7133949.1 MBL fold metallo-hydrolase [Gemmatimonadales bacterium]
MLFLLASLAGAAPVADTTIRVHRFVSSERAYEANAFWIESPTGLVLIDAPLTRSDTHRLIAVMRTSGKPLAGILLTHPHADHFGGIRTVKAAYPGARYFATQATAAGAVRTHQVGLAEGGWLLGYGEDYDRELAVPDSVLPPEATLTLAGMEFLVRDYGPIESENNTVILHRGLGALFSGDATVAGGAFYVGEGYSGPALAALPRILADFATARTVYSGHYGPQAIAPLIEENLAQIRFFRALVAAELADETVLTPNRTVSLDARRRLLRTMAGYLRGRQHYGVGPIAIANLNLGGLLPELLATPSGQAASPLTRSAWAALRPLGYLVGRWAGTQRLPDSVGALAVERPNTVAFEPGPNALTLEGTVESGGLRYRLTLGFDVAQRRYRLVSVDDGSGLLDVYQGVVDSTGALVVSNLESGTHYRDGKGRKIFNRLTFRPLGAAGWIWEVSASADGGVSWNPVTTFAAERRLSELTLTRRGSNSGIRRNLQPA